ncbi:DUF1887 family CARF protein [uncultured Mailhella sp.]|uniref:Card1-like endonuclease domain-containing protein n=1 Tax=uncultured Mailhella sp. TaxID=1981031 RepID=UPI002612D6B8|nr:DUF1887 family CARF protein [uncultured Mailhella sp.]
MKFPKFTHHICLVSEQTLPNYLGTVMPDASPQTVHLVVTDRMKERANILEKALRERGMAVEHYPLASPRPNEMLAVLNAIREKTPSGSLAVNVTGGTKVMALAAVEWAGIQDEHPFLFYVDTDSKKILQIGGKMDEFEMTVKLKVKELLKAGAGASLREKTGESLNKAKIDLLDRLLRSFLKHNSALKLFNDCAQKAKVRQYPYADMPSSCPQGFMEALDMAREAGKLSIASEKIIDYQSEENRSWCNGGWLEHFVKALLYRMQSDGIIDDWGSNVKIPNEQKSLGKALSPNDKNELDAAFTVANRLFLIECKTADLARNNAFPDVIYKLDSLKKSLGGVLSRGMIVSVLEPRHADIQRCEELGIKLVYGTDVLKLEDKLKNWIENVHR